MATPNTLQQTYSQLILDATILLGHVSEQYQSPTLPTFGASDRAHLSKQGQLLWDVILHLRTRSALSVLSTKIASINSASTAVIFAKQLFAGIGALPTVTKSSAKAALKAAVLSLEQV